MMKKAEGLIFLFTFGLQPSALCLRWGIATRGCLCHFLLDGKNEK